MSDEFICYSILVILGIWILYWGALTLNSPAELERFIWRETQAGRKVSFWVTPKGQKIGVIILFISIVIWVLCSICFTDYLNLGYGYLEILFKSWELIAIVLFFCVVICKLISIIAKALGFRKPTKE